VDKVAGSLPLVPPDWRLGLEVPQASETQTAECPGHGRDGSLEQPGDVPEVQALVTEIHSVLQLLRIERPPLGAANTPTIRLPGVNYVGGRLSNRRRTIRQRGWTAGAVTSQQAIGAAQADSVLGGEFRKAAAVFQVLGHQPEAAPLRQASIGMAMHGCVRSGLVGSTSTRSDLTPPCH